MTEIHQKQSQFWFVLITSCIYALLTLFVLVHHEPWRDEADVWLAARDLTLPRLWKWMHYAGTPALWYLMVMPLAKLNFPYIFMSLLHWAITVTTAVLILALAPFPRIVRLAIVFSYHVLYEYAVIARNYAILLLLLVLIASLYRHRYNRPLLLGFLLSLLASTATHGTILAAALLAAWGLDALHHRRAAGRVLLGGLIGTLGVMLALAEVLPSPLDGQLPGGTAVRNPSAVGFVFSRTFLPVYPATEGVSFAKLRRHMPVFIAAWTAPRLLSVILFAGTLWLLRRNPPILLAFLLAFLALLYVFVFKYLGGDRHLGLIWAMVWITFWILLDDPVTAQATRNDRAVWKWGAIPIALSCIYSTGMGLYFSQLDVRRMFSGSKQAAAFLISHKFADRPLGMFKENYCEPILPYLGHKSAWYAGIERQGTYTPWNRQWELSNDGPYEPGIQRLVEKSTADPQMVLILNTELPPQYADQFQEVFTNLSDYAFNAGERYAIYIRRGS